VRQPLLIGSAGQASKAFILEDMTDGNWTESVALLLEQSADVINGEVLFASLDDFLAPGIGLGVTLGAFGRREEERTERVLAEVINQDAETPGRIAESPGSLLGGQFVDEESAEGFVLAMSSIGWSEKDFGWVS